MVDEDANAERSRAPSEAFALFSHELRVEILFTLWDADSHALSYSELKRRVGERDSGKFNYHLSQLVGQFVGQDGDEYELRYPGHRVIDAIRSGFLHENAEVDPVALDSPCRQCGEALTFTYENYLGRVGCVDCEDVVLAFPFDPGGIAARSDEEVAVAFDRRTRLFWRFAVAGVCPVCAGVTHVELAEEPGTELDSHYTDGHPVILSIDCAQCSFYNYPPVGVVTLYHPAIVGWLYDHGVDPRKTPAWAFDCVTDPDRIEIRGDEPLTVAVTLAVDDERLRVALDQSLSVTSIERRPADPDRTL